MLSKEPFFKPEGIILKKAYVSSEMLLARLRDLIEHHYKEIRNPAFYSKELAYGLRSLNIICIEYTGKTVFMLVQERLAMEAERLLANTPLSTKQIAFELGFLDPAYFCRFFRKMRELSPGDYRRRHKNIG